MYIKVPVVAPTTLKASKAGELISNKLGSEQNR